MPLDTISTSARTELSAIAREIETATDERDEIQRRHDRIDQRCRIDPRYAAHCLQGPAISRASPIRAS